MTLRTRRRSGRLICTLLVVCGLGSKASESAAQLVLGGRGSPPSSPPSPTATLRSRLGIEVANGLLRSQNSAERQRGFERLGSVGSAQALDSLLHAFDPGGAARSARERLIAVRALCPYAAQPAVRDFLIRIMVGVGSNSERADAAHDLTEHAAALALARSADDTALSALAKTLRQAGHVANTARDALLAFPPRDVRVLTSDLRAPTPTFASLLGDLGDVRAIPALRDFVRGAPVGVRPSAAVALAELGDPDTLELARHWLEHEHATDFRLAGARILLQLRAPDTGAWVGRLLMDDDTRAGALELASVHALPAASAALIRLLGQGSTRAGPDDRSALFAALGLSGTREAVSFLGGALGTRETSSVGALALALAPSGDADHALESALRTPSTRRAAVRASLVRNFALGRTPSGLSSAVDALSASRDASDRAVAAQARALLSPGRAAELLKSATPSEVRAVARAALMPEVALALAERLSRESNPALAEALAACLISDEAGERVPSAVLSRLIDARGLAAPIAARLLARRDSPSERATIASLLDSQDPLLRGQTALGLGRSEDPSALGRLENAYRFEADDGVRLAIVRALTMRREPARRRLLTLARTLDGSAEVRALAQLELARAEHAGRPDRSRPGTANAWLDLSLTDAVSHSFGAAPALGACVITSDGDALPAFADPDGVLLLPALPGASFELRLAAPARTDDALASHESRQSRAPREPRRAP